MAGRSRGQWAGAVGKRTHYKHCTWRRKKNNNTRLAIIFFSSYLHEIPSKMSACSSSTWERGRDEALFFSPAYIFRGVARAEFKSP